MIKNNRYRNSIKINMQQFLKQRKNQENGTETSEG